MDDDFFDELSLFLNETPPMDASYSTEPNFFVIPDMPPSPLLGEYAFTNPLEPPIPAALPASSFPIDANNQHLNSPRPSNPTFQTTTGMLNFMPTPNLTSLPAVNDPVTPINPLVLGLMDPFPSQSLPALAGNGMHGFLGEGSSQQQYLPLASYFGLQNQAPHMEYQRFNPNPEPRLSRMDSVNLMEQNWEAIASYLAGQVRPGPDVPRVYRCSICFVEFPNAQAFGGHMSSHSKGKRKMKDPPSTIKDKDAAKKGKNK